MAKITYTNKNAAANPEDPEKNWRAVDANEVKQSVNDLYDIVDEIELGTGGVASVTGDGVDNTDPANPVISFPDISDITGLQTALDAKADSLITTRSLTGAHTLDATDLAYIQSGKQLTIRGDNTGDLTIPLNATQAFPVGTVLMLRGFENILAAVGVSVNSSAGNFESPGVDVLMAITKTGTNAWFLDNGFPAGSGDVNGPDESVNNNIATFDGTTGKFIKDSGKEISADSTFSASSDNKIPTERAVRLGTLPRRRNIVAQEHDDYLGVHKFLSFTSGTGASLLLTSSSANVDDIHHGQAHLTTGTTSSGYAYSRTSNLGCMRFGFGEVVFSAIIKTGNTLSDETDAYTIEVGFENAVIGNGNAYVRVRYSHDLNGGKWQYETMSGPGFSTEVDSGVTVAVNTWYRITIVINEAGTSANFRINGEFSEDISTTMPVVALGFCAGLYKRAGTTARTMNIDLMEYICELISER